MPQEHDLVPDDESEQDRPKRQGRERKVPRPATKERLHRAALHYLERFSSSSENLRRVLMRRVDRSARLHDTDPEQGAHWVDKIVERFVASGLLNDRVYAEGRAQSLLRRGSPPAFIRRSLRAKGVGDLDIDAALETLEDENENVEWEAALAYAKRRRLGRFRLRDVPAEQAQDRARRDLAAMGRAGFGPDLARKVLQEDG